MGDEDGGGRTARATAWTLTVMPLGSRVTWRLTPTTASSGEQAHCTSSAPLAVAIARARPVPVPAAGVSAASAARSAAACIRALVAARSPTSTASMPARSTNTTSASPMSVTDPASPSRPPPRGLEDWRGVGVTPFRPAANDGDGGADRWEDTNLATRTGRSQRPAPAIGGGPGHRSRTVGGAPTGLHPGAPACPRLGDPGPPPSGRPLAGVAAVGLFMGLLALGRGPVPAAPPRRPAR